MQTQKTVWRQVVKVRADKLDLKIRALHPANPGQCTWRGPIETSIRNPDRTVQPHERLRGTRVCCVNELGIQLGITNPVCIPHIGTGLVHNAPEEDEDDADTAQRGDEVDPFGLNVSAIVQQGNPWKTRHDKFEDLIVMLMQHSGMSAKGEPRNVVKLK